MGRTRITPGERVDFTTYFATYVDETLTRSVAPGAVQHLRDYGHSLLGSSKDADRIVDEWLTEKG